MLTCTISPGQWDLAMQWRGTEVGQQVDERSDIPVCGSHPRRVGANRRPSNVGHRASGSGSSSGIDRYDVRANPTRTLPRLAHFFRWLVQDEEEIDRSPMDRPRPIVRRSRPDRPGQPYKDMIGAAPAGLLSGETPPIIVPVRH